MHGLSTQNATKDLEKVLIVSQNDTSQVKKILLKKRFSVIERNPDFILCYGGDGTVLFSERKFPEVPKLVVKRSNICKKCDFFENSTRSYEEAAGRYY